MSPFEFWVDIPMYVGTYMCSNLGRIKSLDRKVKDKRLGFRNLKGTILKQAKHKESGYMGVELNMDNCKQMWLVHRLIAFSFIPNPESKSDVNHKNGVRDDNNVENLEWATRSENVKHGFDSNGRQSAVRKSIICLNTNQVFESITEASKEFNISISSISAVCNNERAFTYGYKFAFHA